MFAALLEIQAQMPFRVLGIDSDNGSEFINHHLLRWCADNEITFTRSRPNNSNDGCHVEQKNWAVARRAAGYWRDETAREMALLNQIWTALSPLTNLFTPQHKLVSKTRRGAKVIKKYDIANALPAPPRPSRRPRRGRRHAAGETIHTINPAQARRDVSDLQKTLLAMVAHKNTTRRAKHNAVYLSRAKLDESTTKAQAGILT